ncbi:MAG: AlbA family DNA-binding domain-containing protein [Promethearchaeota archaeon]
MSIPSQRKIRELLAAGESSRLDYKGSYHLRTDENKNELAKDVCAIANFLYQASGKGYLVIGVDNNGTPIGVNHSDYQETRLQQIIGARTDPPPIFHVHHVSYSNYDLVIIEIRRIPSGPHQVKIGVKSLGFPTRRGSSTEAMDTIEVFQAMQARGRSFIRSPSEYRTLSPSTAISQIRDDIIGALVETGKSRRSIKIININTTSSFFGGKFIHIIKVINRRRWNFYITWSYRNENLDSLLWLENSFEGLARSIPQNRSIFIHLVNGSISNSYFTNRQRLSSSFVKVPIEPRITYFGLGEGATRYAWTKPMSIPKFYVSHIKSKDDIKMRLELIMKWINQQNSMFENIRSVLS